MADHANGTALIFARTDTAAFHRYCFNRAVSGLFIEGRLTFYTVNGRQGVMQAGAPSVLLAYSLYDAERLDASGIAGKHLSFQSWCYITTVEGTWRQVVGRALSMTTSKDLKVLYIVVKRIAPTKVSRNRHYKEKVRQTLQIHYRK